MAVNDLHPDYSTFLEDWITMRDCYRGQRQVKEKKYLYLPATSGMVEDGLAGGNSEGSVAYKAYLTRAYFPDIIAEAVEAMIGVMHHKPPVIELPESMEPLREKATRKNESLEMLLRRINEEQLITGRLGLLADLPPSVPAGEQPIPYLAMYVAETVLNWDAGRVDGLEVQSLNLVALDETEYERQADFSWEEVTKTRVLVLGDPLTNEADGTALYAQAVFREDADFDPSKLVEPSIRGNKLEEIPFVFINSKDVVPTPDDPPNIGLANLALAIYRGEADYRQNLFMQGQDTLVTMGLGADMEDEKLRVGAGGRVDLQQGGDAKFIGVSSTGLPEQRQSLENDYSRASSKGGQLLDSVSREKESGDALKVRVAARTATLNQIALAGAFGLQDLLRKVAVWMGADPQQVIVTPNLDFISDSFNPADLNQMMTAKVSGAPLSLESIHAWLKEKDMTVLEFEEEMQRIEEEEPLGGTTADPDLLPDDDDDGNVNDNEDEDDPDQE